MVFHNKKKWEVQIKIFLYKSKLIQNHKFKIILFIYLTLFHFWIWFSEGGIVIWLNLSNITYKSCITQECFLLKLHENV